MTKSKEILQKYWGYDNFRPLQEEIVDSVVYGHDTLAILPTGGGKSICFQVPGMALDGITIVVSPLIALMEDQVTNLRAKGIKAEMITSAMSYREIDITLDNARFGKVKFLYTSPERLKSDLFRERCKTMNVSLITVDEAHCISEWGHDFRPAYKEIAELREMHPDAPIIAVTASATELVQKDILEQLKLKKPNQFNGNLDRENISYKVVASQNKLKSVSDFCQVNKEHSGIVYCQTRRSVKMVVKHLRALNISAGFYHGGLSPDDRKYMLEHWMTGKLKVMIATNAFGMGIDKPDVRFVLHFEVPNNLEAYYQEAGRAGRDENAAQAVAFWENKDIEHMREQLATRYPEIERVKHIYNGLCNYLKIAIGSGEQETYDLNIRAFQQAFNISISESYYGLKILQLNGTLNFTENSFHPTRLKFAIGSSALYKFQVTHDSVAGLITLLTRSYPGIFERFVRINETELCKRLKISKAKLNEQLLFLEQYGVADVNFQTNLPKITLLTERFPDGYLTISPKIYGQRKQVEEAKLKAIIDFLTTSNCRAEMISLYFDSPAKKCGKCDVCISEQSSNYTHKELLELLPTKLPSTLEQLVHSLECKEDEIQKALQVLLLEEKVVCNDDVFSLI
ncbi:MAG: RecQ family ATP-dependent DNA helicase [Crocinitomicaceae bacterium]|nr:RecQ family ATP-dependent DNA helicase [Crocinitomicaceae bacterium]